MPRKVEQSADDLTAEFVRHYLSILNEVDNYINSNRPLDTGYMLPAVESMLAYLRELDRRGGARLTPKPPKARRLS